VPAVFDTILDLNKAAKFDFVFLFQWLGMNGFGCINGGGIKQHKITGGQNNRPTIVYSVASVSWFNLTCRD